MPPKKKIKKAVAVVTIDPLQIQPNDAVVNAGQNCYPSSRPHATVKYAKLCSDASLEYIQAEKEKKAGTMTFSDYREVRDVVARRCFSGIRLLKKVDGGLLEVVSDPLHATRAKITSLQLSRNKQERIANARASNEIVQVAPEKSVVVISSLSQFHCDDELAEAKTFAESEYARLTRQMSDAKEGDRHVYTELRRDIAKNFVQTAQSEGYQFLLETGEAFMILPLGQACEAILRVLSNILSKSKGKVNGQQQQITKGDYAALIEDDSREANTTRDALFKNIGQKVFRPTPKTSTGSLAITTITPNAEMDVSCLPSDLTEDAESLGCIETSYKSNLGLYPRTSFTMDGTLWRSVPLHQLACCVECGPRSQPISKEKCEEITASHICQNAKCINPKHLRWETMRDNLNRQGCYGYVMLKKGSKFKFVQTTRCTHKVRCMNFFQVNIED